MLREFIDAFLANEHVGAGVFNGVHQVANVVLLFLEKQGELVGVRDLNLGVNFGLFHFDGGVDQRNFCS